MAGLRRVPSGTEDVYKIYAESFLGKDHLHKIQHEARAVIEKTFAAARWRLITLANT